MRYILTFLKTHSQFKEGFSIACEKINQPMHYEVDDKTHSFKGVYRFKDISGKSKFIDMPFKFEGTIYKIREEPQTD